jgi:autotransporter translocation and assembly factor TamB
VGELNGERGTYTLRAGPIIRRFDVVAAKIRFLGGRDINPALDISARRRVVDLNGQQFDIEVKIRGTMERPTLALASEEQRSVPQSELLSFLLFGRPSVAIGGTSLTAQKEIGETYIGGIAELLSMELEQAFIDQLGMGLDVFQIRLGGGRLSNLDRAAVVVGEEIRNNLFLTVEYGVNSLFGGTSGTTATTASNASTFAVRLEWNFTRSTNLRASYEPVNQSLLVRNYARSQLDEHAYQWGLELRRRWTW